MMGGIEMSNLTYICVFVSAVPFFGGLADGICRNIASRIQGRPGPPIIQPHFDFLKLVAKQRIRVNVTQPVLGIMQLMLAITAFTYFVLGQDLLKIIFVLICCDLTLIFGAACVESPYSRMAARREVWTLVLFSSMLIMVAGGAYLVTGSFMAGSVFNSGVRVLHRLPLLIYPLFFSLLLKMGKSPVDFSIPQGRHQELAGGTELEFSGPYLALVKLARWYEIALLAGLACMLSHNMATGILLSAVMFVVAVIADNTMCRMSWQWAYKNIFPVGILVVAANVLWLYI